MKHCGFSDDYTSKLLCVKCNTLEFEIVNKLDSGEIVARCGICGQETDLEVLVGSRYDGAVELLAALRSLYSVSAYKAKQNNDEIGLARYSKKHDHLQEMINAPMYPNPLNMAADLFKMIENTSVNLVEAKKIIDSVLKRNDS
ncbi:hypothetical protein SCACP_09920 [Sporomusa carbonis]|uniref:hypothetical protein n=1 Tax=Sporomusa carbonis TaxID=3076075 RepID=UPI003A5F63DD